MMDMENRYKEIVELLVNEFKDLLDRYGENDEEGLIPCSGRTLIQLKRHLEDRGIRVEKSGTIHIPTKPMKGE